MNHHRRLRHILIGVSFTALMAANAHATPFINEIHYDNSGADTGEFIEIAVESGFDLTGWSLSLYNGNGGGTYGSSVSLSGLSYGNAFNGYHFAAIDYPSNGIQNGAPDGIALISNTGTLHQFISYEGAFDGTSGAATGVSSADIGVRETSSTAIGHSLQLGDSGWQDPQASTKGAANTNQTQFANGLTIGGQGDTGGGDGGGGEPAVEAAIYDIQGAGHKSAMEGQTVATSGIVTAVTSSGYYIQDPTGDGNGDTSDAVYVYTGSANPPTVAVGDSVRIQGEVTEYARNSSELTLTEITNSQVIEVVSSGNSLPAALSLSAPTTHIDTDGLGSFNPATDGIDYYESVEGMRVVLNNAQAVGATNGYGELYAVNSATATGMNDRGGITLDEGDFNPEKIQIDDTALNGNSPQAQMGDSLGSVAGVMSYSYGNFELLATETITATDGGLAPEVSQIVAADDRLTVASYNVENLAAGDGRIAEFGQQIVNNLNSPDIIGLQEIQDNNGTGSGELSASQTYADLIQAIKDAGGPEYAVAALDPEAMNSTGGQGNGNIRNGFLYRVDRVDVKDVSFIDGYDTDTYIDPAGVEKGSFDSSRPPLVGTFMFNGQEVTIVNNHARSRGGSDPLFGANQPINTGKPEKRNAEMAFVNAFIKDMLDQMPGANVIALGDMNAFWFEEALALLAGQELFNLATLFAEEERYSTIFEGVSQALDHMLVSGSLFGSALFDYVHLNSGFLSQLSDHDPLLASFRIARISEPGQMLLILMGLVALYRRRQSQLMA
ncbi:endonuclease/exonuclease/phosphatase family protein [Paremcibacter congregatus]|uniref:endonuclease/exonuclease/phosphatase family protein n=1 Tax=Paremcibacter congregatus TaxID=2043170 RepID=UPI0030EE7BB8|tara:strand:+ start:308 stop:2647 length:2340 start_codon:yes stop_codon:yes gene_type:complete